MQEFEFFAHVSGDVPFVHVIDYITCAVAFCLLLACLLGFYEKRDATGCRLNVKKFLVTIPAITIYAVLSWLCVTIYLGNISSKASTDAREHLERSIMLWDRGQNQMAVALAPDISKQELLCLSAAISNYIEDLWGKNIQKTTCVNQELCSSNEEEAYKKLLHYHESSHHDDIFLPPFTLLHLYAVKQVTGLSWKVAKEVFDKIESFSILINPLLLKDVPGLGRDAQAYEEFMGYVKNCEKFQPAFWITPDKPLVTSPAGYVFSAPGGDSFFEGAHDRRLYWGLSAILLMGSVYALLGTRKFLNNFSFRHKWASRVLVCCAFVSLIIPIYGITGPLLSMTQLRLTPEFPFLTSSSIKAGMFRIVRASASVIYHEDMLDYYRCVAAIVDQDLNRLKETCKTDKACLQASPIKTKEEILQKIRPLQANPKPVDGKFPDGSQIPEACYRAKFP